MSADHFRWAFARTESPARVRAAFDTHVVPTAGRLYFQLALGIGSGVRFGNSDRPPLLLVAGEADRSVALAMVRANQARYSRSRAITDYVSFPNRPHFLIGSEGWEEVADYVLAWCAQQAPAGDLATRRTIRAGTLPA